MDHICILDVKRLTTAIRMFRNYSLQRLHRNFVTTMWDANLTIINWIWAVIWGQCRLANTGVMWSLFLVVIPYLWTVCHVVCRLQLLQSRLLVLDWCRSLHVTSIDNRLIVLSCFQRQRDVCIIAFLSYSLYCSLSLIINANADDVSGQSVWSV